MQEDVIMSQIEKSFRIAAFVTAMWVLIENWIFSAFCIFTIVLSLAVSLSRKNWLNGVPRENPVVPCKLSRSRDD